MSGPNYCVTKNTCELTVQGAPPCGSKPEHLATMSPPGSLCINALWQQLETISNFSGENSFETNRLLVQRAGLALELSAVPAPTITDVEAEAYTAFATRLLTEELDPSGLRCHLFTEANLLTLFSSNFRYGTRTDNNCPNVAEEICRLMSEVRQAPRHSSGSPEHQAPDPDHRPCFPSETERKGVYSKLACIALCELAGLTLTPATLRCHRACDVFVETDDRTVPVKFISSAKNSLPEAAKKNKELVVIPFINLIERANTLAPGKYIIPTYSILLAPKIAEHIELGGASVGTPTNKAQELIARAAEQLRGKFYQTA